MTNDEEREQLRQENTVLREALQKKDEKLHQSRKSNQDLREGLKEAIVEEVLTQIWARKMKDLLLEMKAEVEQAKASGHQELDLLVLARLLCRYDEILMEGYQANPPPPAPENCKAQGRVFRYASFKAHSEIVHFHLLPEILLGKRGNRG